MSGLRCGSSEARAHAEWGQELLAFETAGAELLGGRCLQNRVEAKYVMPAAAALRLVRTLSSDYVVVLAGQARLASYRSLYFDTPELTFFDAHRRGRRLRQKVRIRDYRDRLTSFLELKQRVGDGVTRKHRCERPFGHTGLAPCELAFLAMHGLPWTRLLPQVWVDYTRVTLLNTRAPERVTIDLDIGLRRGTVGGRLLGLAVVEVKQECFNRSTPVVRQLRADGQRESWASKYCAGVVLTTPGVRANRLLPGVRRLRTVGTWVS